MREQPGRLSSFGWRLPKRCADQSHCFRDNDDAERVACCRFEAARDETRQTNHRARRRLEAVRDVRNHLRMPGIQDVDVRAEPTCGDEVIGHIRAVAWLVGRWRWPPKGARQTRATIRCSRHRMPRRQSQPSASSSRSSAQCFSSNVPLVKALSFRLRDTTTSHGRRGRTGRAPDPGARSSSPGVPAQGLVPCPPRRRDQVLLWIGSGESPR